MLGSGKREQERGGNIGYSIGKEGGCGECYWIDLLGKGREGLAGSSQFHGSEPGIRDLCLIGRILDRQDHHGY